MAVSRRGEILVRRTRPVDARGGGATAVRSRLPRGDARRPPTQIRTPAGPAGRQRAGRQEGDTPVWSGPRLRAQWDRLLERRESFLHGGILCCCIPVALRQPQTQASQAPEVGSWLLLFAALSPQPPAPPSL
ncbi:transmembrane protein 80 isoform X9 [Physeter macrocephalus]|uniref:Transmembrane protein 80 isoform X9 n=1 Tax=Physeter macrocephalus TaxID=9755 RepID=A0A9W2W9K2_PHYMC|nr:transmembrane protein 80 isoform X9 [Physeter catodon]